MTASALRTAARAAVLHASGDLRVAVRPVREPGPGEVVVAVAAVGVCGSDLHYVTEGRNGTNVLDRPTVLGHEAGGTVAAAGPGTTLPVGTPVAIEPAVGCGWCRDCRAGRYNLCPASPCLGSPPTDGAMTELLVMAERHLHPLPPEIDAETGALIEPLAVAVWAVRRAGVAPGDRVLVTGAGPIGVLAAQVARAAGAGVVTVTDVVDARLAAAARLGATRTVNTAQVPLDVGGVDHVLECSGVPAVVVDAATRIRPGGRLVLVGLCRPTLDAVPLGHLQRHEIDLLGTFRYANAFPAAIDLVRTGAVDVRSIVTLRCGLAEVASAVRAPLDDPAQLKVLVVPDL